MGWVFFHQLGIGWWVWLKSLGRAVCSGQASHQALQDSLCGIELPESRMMYVLLILQVKDGEVDGGKAPGEGVMLQWGWKKDIH
jgi:hypothetical protein